MGLSAREISIECLHTKLKGLTECLSTGPEPIKIFSGHFTLKIISIGSVPDVGG